MEEILKKKDIGTKKMNNKEYNNAIILFSEVIDDLKPENDQEAVIKSISLLNRSLCNIQLNNEIEAMKDLLYVTQTIQLVRPNLTYDNAEVETDPLVTILSLAEFRKGQLYMVLGDFLNSIRSFSYSIKLTNNEEAKTCIKNIYFGLGYQEIDPHDDDLKIWQKLVDLIPYKLDLLEHLNEITNRFLDDNGFSDEVLDKFAEKGCYCYVIGLLQLYMKDENVCLVCIILSKLFAEKGVEEIFDGIPVITSVLEEYSEKINIIETVINFLYLSPPDLVQDCDELLPLICGSLKHNIGKSEYEKALTIIFKSVTRATILEKISRTDVVSSIFERRNSNSIHLLSKLASNEMLCIQIHLCGGYQLIMNTMNVKDPIFISSALVLLLRFVLIIPNHIKENISDIVGTVTHVIMNNSDVVDILIPGYNILSILASNSLESIRKSKTIKVSSLIFHIHRKNKVIIKQIVSFLYTVAQAGMIDDIKENPNLIQRLLELLLEYADSQEIFEKVIAITVLCKYPNFESFLEFGLKRYPNSSILLPLDTKK